MDYIQKWAVKTETPLQSLIRWLGLAPSKFYDWRERYGQVNEHNAKIPRDHWLDDGEKSAIVEYYKSHPYEGYRRLTYMMLDENIIAVSPSSVLRVLRAAGLLERWNRKKSLKGTGFVQPTRPHEHWHMDITYVNIGGCFYFLLLIVDGYSRYIVHWALGSEMPTLDINIALEASREKFPNTHARIISDNGPQFISRDFKEFIRFRGFTHVRTSPYYPQSNGKCETCNRTVKHECLHRKPPRSPEEAREILGQFIAHYNNRRLHSAIGYIAPKDKLEGREQSIWDDRDRKLETARELRRRRRQAARQPNCSLTNNEPLDTKIAPIIIPSAE